MSAPDPSNSVAVRHPLGARAGWRAARVLVRTVWTLEVRGADLVPRTGPALLAVNHINAIDGVVLAAASPRPVHNLAKRELFRGPLAWALPLVGAIAVDRDGVDRAGLAAALDLLRAGGALGVFPEGTRAAGGRFTTLRPGLAWFAVRSGAPVVPVVVAGTAVRGRTLGALPPPRARLRIVFGAPLTVEVGARTGRARLAAATEQVERHLRGHLAAVEAAADDGASRRDQR